MGDDASAALGARELAGTFVNPKGFAKKTTATVAGGKLAGAVGSLAAGAVANRSSGATADLPSFGRVGYVAVTQDDVALVKTKTGAFKMKISDEVLARVPRVEISSVEFDEGTLLSHLSIAFTNGGVWQFDIPRQAKKAAQGVFRALQVSQPTT